MSTKKEQEKTATAEEASAPTEKTMDKKTENSEEVSEESTDNTAKVEVDAKTDTKTETTSSSDTAPIPEERKVRRERHDKRRGFQREKPVFDIEQWIPKTKLGLQVKNKEITTLSTILERGQTILEAEIVDALLPDLEVDFMMVGQAKGKFGGGQRRIFKQTQKKTNEGNKPSFSTVIVVGNKKGFVGIGYGKGRETVPAREKALRQAKLNIMKVPLGSGSWEGNPEDTNSIPFKVSGKVSSVQITLIPAPKGTGLHAPSECSRIFRLVGMQDIWTQTLGQTKTTTNLIRATIKALAQLSKMVVAAQTIKKGEKQ